MIHKLLQDEKIVLASASPRRKDLLEMLGLKPLIFPAGVDETQSRQRPHLQAMRHAKDKALHVAKSMDENSLIIGADTIVVLEGKVLGKPSNASQAREYLAELSGKTHAVYTGLCLCRSKRCESAYERSLVEFAPLSQEEIQAYVETGEPMDKAGAYGIQGFGSQFIKRVNGCYFNVMGFPIHLFYNILKDIYREITFEE